MTSIKAFIVRLWNILIEQMQDLDERSIPPEELTIILKQLSIPSVSFYSLLALSALIASFGLLSDNAVTIVGAMIVAPLMNPITTLAYSTISESKGLAKRAIFTLITGVIWVILIAFLGTELVGTKVVSEQILSRVTPNLLDLGVAIASGSAASLAYSRRSISTALPGVAIAVALVPPLCVVGIGLALGESAILDIGTYFSRQGQPLNIPGGAFLLFLTNLVGIIFSAGLVFIIQGYGSLRNSLVRLALTLAVLVLLSLPLSFQLQNFLLRNQVIESLTKFDDTYYPSEKEEWIEVIDVTDIYLDNRKNEIYMQLNLIAPINSISQSDVDLAQEFLSEDLGKPVRLQVHVFPFQILQKESLSPPK